MHDQEYLTPEEASKYLRLSLGSIYKFIQQNDLPASPEGRSWKIKRSAIEEFLNTWGEREEFPDH